LLLQCKRFRLFLHIFPQRGLSVCRLSHSCTLLKPLDRFRCRLAGTKHFWRPMTHCVRWGVPNHAGEGGIWWVAPRAKTCNCKLQPNRGSWRIQTRSSVDWTCHGDSAVCPNYIGPCLLTYAAGVLTATPLVLPVYVDVDVEIAEGLLMSRRSSDHWSVDTDQCDDQRSSSDDQWLSLLDMYSRAINRADISAVTGYDGKFSCHVLNQQTN